VSFRVPNPRQRRTACNACPLLVVGSMKNRRTHAAGDLFVDDDCL